MPKNIRPFWIDAKIDGRETSLSGGPASRDGGFDMDVLQRSKGSVFKALSIRGSVVGTEVCTTVVLPQESDTVRVEVEQGVIRIYTEV